MDIENLKTILDGEQNNESAGSDAPSYQEPHRRPNNYSSSSDSDVRSILDLNLLDGESGLGHKEIDIIGDMVAKQLQDDASKMNVGLTFRSLLIANNKEYGQMDTPFFSTLLVYADVKGYIVTYPILFAQSQEDALTVQDILDYDDRTRQEIASKSIKSFSEARNFRTNDYCVDEDFIMICKDHLSKATGKSHEKIMVLPGVIYSTLLSMATEEDRKLLVNRSTFLSYNSIYTFVETVMNKTAKDISVHDLLKTRDSQLSIDLTINRSNYSTLDLTGNANRQNFSIVTSIKKNDRKVSRSYNQKGGQQRIIQTGGFLDAIPYVEKVERPYETIRKVRFMPHVVITNIAMATSTPNMFLLGLVNASVLLEKEVSLTVFKNNIGTPSDPSNLDVIAKISNEFSDGKDAKLDLTNKKLTEDTVNGILKEMFSGDTVLSLDILPYTSSTTATTMFQVAATQANSDSAKALKDIIAVANGLTDGRFSANSGITEDNVRWDDVFSNVTYFPGGYYFTTSAGNELGINDMRDIDLARVAGECKGSKESYIKDWTDSIRYENRDECILEQLNVMKNGLGLTAGRVSTRGVRITFASRFILALQEALVSAGLKIDFKATTLNLTTGSGYDYSEDIYRNSRFSSNGASIYRSTGGSSRSRYSGWDNNRSYGAWSY